MPYENKAAEDKKRYEDEKASYNVSALTLTFQINYRALTTQQADAEEEESG